MVCAIVPTTGHFYFQKRFKNHMFLFALFKNIAWTDDPVVLYHCLFHDPSTVRRRLASMIFSLSFDIAPLIRALGTRLDAEYSVGYRLVLR